MEYNLVVWFEFYVENMKRAKAFNEALLAIAFEEGMNISIFPMEVDKSGS